MPAAGRPTRRTSTCSYAKRACSRSSSGLGTRPSLEDDVSSKDRRRLGLQSLCLLEERVEAPIPVVVRVLRHARNLRIDQVKGYVVPLFGAVLDACESRLQELALAAQLLPQRQLLRFEEALELGGLFLSDPDDDCVGLRHHTPG